MEFLSKKILKQVEYESARRKNTSKRNQKKRGTRPPFSFFDIHLCFILHKTATKSQENSRELKEAQGNSRETQGNSRELKGTQGNFRELKGTQGN